MVLLNKSDAEVWAQIEAASNQPAQPVKTGPFAGINEGFQSLQKGVLPKSNLRKKKSKKAKAKRKTKGCGCK